MEVLDRLVDRGEEGTRREGEITVDVARLVGEVRRGVELLELLPLRDLREADGLAATTTSLLVSGENRSVPVVDPPSVDARTTRRDSGSALISSVARLTASSAFTAVS